MNSSTTPVTREQLLADLTHKHEPIEIGQRVYYTLVRPQSEWAGGPAPTEEAIRAAKFMGMLVQHLSESGHISADQLDTWLLHAVK